MTEQSRKESWKQSKRKRRAQKSDLERKLDGLGWGLFFVWIGTVMLMDLGSGVALLGIGVITLGVQATRKLWDLKIESFWVVVGLIFFLSGIWSLFESKLPLVPILLIVAGLAVLVTTFARKRREDT
ncbi:MAG: hypothetical protein ACC669_02635 [bacterium]